MADLTHAEPPSSLRSALSFSVIDRVTDAGFPSSRGLPGPACFLFFNKLVISHRAHVKLLVAMTAKMAGSDLHSIFF